MHVTTVLDFDFWKGNKTINQSTYRAIAEKEVMKNNLCSLVLRLFTPPNQDQTQMRERNPDEILTG